MTPRSQQPWRIVVTDDDPKLMAFLIATLRSAGHVVFAAYDGESACELALVIPHMDLLVTNSRIGNTTGRQLIRQVRDKRPRLPVLHIGEPLPNPDGLLDDVPSLREPFTAEELLAKVSELVTRKHE